MVTVRFNDIIWGNEKGCQTHIIYPNATEQGLLKRLIQKAEESILPVSHGEFYKGCYI